VQMMPSKLSKLGMAALVYADRFGFHVFPLLKHRKEPNGWLAPHGHHSATCEPARITQWWRTVPNANVGIACAVSGLCVLDIDPRNGGDETLAHLEEPAPLPHTWTVLTPSGGQHFYFRYRGVGRVVGSLGDGIDVKHDGYVVAPPSVHPNGGVYRWDAGAHPLESSMAELPPSLQRQPSKTDAGAPVGPAVESFLGIAFAAASWLGRPLGGGKCAVRCPWLHEHSCDGRDRAARGAGQDSSAALLPPTSDARLGAFRCQHGHCAGRTTLDVLRVLPPEAIDRAARAYPQAYKNALYRLARPAHVGIPSKGAMP